MTKKMTEEQQFLMDARCRGLSYAAVAEAYEKRYNKRISRQRVHQILGEIGMQGIKYTERLIVYVPKPVKDMFLELVSINGGISASELMRRLIIDAYRNSDDVEEMIG